MCRSSNSLRDIIMFSRALKLSVFTSGVVSVLLLTACGSKSVPVDPMAAQGPVEVGVITVDVADVALTVELPGRTSAFRKAEVRPQVTGIIQKRLFEEGTEIEAGAQLYQIDAATYQAAEATAKAELARAEANIAATEARAKRYEDLASKQAISRQDYDDAIAALGQARASLAAGKAAVTAAGINLQYTKVMAPISGVIGKSSVTEGALVTAGQAEPLAIIQQLDPIYVDVSQSATQLLQLRRAILDGSVAKAEAAKVRLLLDDGSFYEHEGELQFSEVGVDESTGTVVLRAIFPNPDRLLLPGMFVRAQVQEGMRADAMLVPQRGISRDRSGNATALVVNSAGEVELRQLRTSRAVGNQWVVEEGLSVGDAVIVEGLQKIRVGVKVNAVPAQIATNNTVSNDQE
jgi:membrane fusion protein (multidrug efflux system)